MGKQGEDADSPLPLILHRCAREYGSELITGTLPEIVPAVWTQHVSQTPIQRYSRGIEGLLMKWVLLIVGLVVGFVAGAGILVYLQERNRATQDTGEMAIIFAKKFYYDNSELVTVSGTLTGPGQAYPNNTYSIACFKERKECWLTSVSAIGTQQIGRMDPPYAYEVRKWSDYEVVAGDNGTLACIKTTLTIDRKSEQVLWVEEPVNQTKVMCAKSENKTRKFTIENSPGWDKIFGKKP